MAEDLQVCITEKDPLVVITTSLGLRGGGAEVLNGETVHLDADLAHRMGVNGIETEIETGTETETEVGIENATETGTRTEILIGRGTEAEGATGRARKEVNGFQCLRRRL